MAARVLPWQKPKPTSVVITVESPLSAKDQLPDPETVRFKQLLSWIGYEEPEKILPILGEMEARGLKADAVSCHTAVVGLLLRSSPPRIESALSVVKSAMVQGVQPHCKTLNYVMLALSASRPSLVDECKELFDATVSKGEADIVSFSAILSACANSSPPRAKTALDILGSMARAGLRPDVQSYTSVISSCAKSYPPLIDDVRNIESLMRRKGITLDPQAHCELVRAFVRSPDPLHLEAERILTECRSRVSLYQERQRQQCIRAHTMLMWSYARSQAQPDAGSAERLMDQLTATGLTPSTSLCNGLAVTYMKSSQSEKCIQLLKRMKTEWGGSPDSTTYSAAIQSCIAAVPRRPLEALELLEDMRTLSLPRAAFTHHTAVKTALSVLSRVGPSETDDLVGFVNRVFCALEKWRTVGDTAPELERIATTLLTAMPGLLENFKGPDALASILRRISPTFFHAARSSTLVHVLQGLSSEPPSSSNSKIIQSIAEIVLQKSTGDRQKTFSIFARNLLLNIYSRIDPPRVDICRKLLEEGVESGSVDAVSWNTFLVALGRWRDPSSADEAVEIFEKMKSIGPTALDERSENILLKVLCSASPPRHETAIEILTEMNRRGAADTISFNTVISALAKMTPARLLDISLITRAMLDSGVQPDTITLNMLLTSNSRSSEAQLRVMRKLVDERNVKPDTRSYNIILSSFLNKKPIPINIIKQLVTDMARHTVPPNDRTHALLEKLLKSKPTTTNTPSTPSAPSAPAPPSRSPPPHKSREDSPRQRDGVSKRLGPALSRDEINAQFRGKLIRR